MLWDLLSVGCHSPSNSWYCQRLAELTALLFESQIQRNGREFSDRVTTVLQTLGRLEGLSKSLVEAVETEEAGLSRLQRMSLVVLGTSLDLLGGFKSISLSDHICVCICIDVCVCVCVCVCLL